MIIGLGLIARREVGHDSQACSPHPGHELGSPIRQDLLQEAIKPEYTGTGTEGEERNGRNWHPFENLPLPVSTGPFDNGRSLIKSTAMCVHMSKRPEMVLKAIFHSSPTQIHTSGSKIAPAKLFYSHVDKGVFVFKWDEDKTTLVDTGSDSLLNEEEPCGGRQGGRPNEPPVCCLDHVFLHGPPDRVWANWEHWNCQTSQNQTVLKQKQSRS